LKVGYSPELNNLCVLGPITFPKQVETIRHHLQDALDKGAKILTGGEPDGMFMNPTVLVDVRNDMLVMQEETFGPILPIVKVKHDGEAIRLANDNHYGLGASVWSQNLKHAEEVALQLQTGSVVINDTIVQMGVPMLPFGGVKDSGFGRTHGREGLLAFTTSQAHVVGKPPYAWDVGTIARSPGNYRLLSTIIYTVFGTSPQQKAKPIMEALDESPMMKMALGIGTAGAVATAMITLMKKRKFS
jgi:delta 1-pyrroline-5-carboxylate dehydrogenase